jgi:hypothetical protein
VVVIEHLGYLLAREIFSVGPDGVGIVEDGTGVYVDTVIEQVSGPVHVLHNMPHVREQRIFAVACI